MSGLEVASEQPSAGKRRIANVTLAWFMEKAFLTEANKPESRIARPSGYDLFTALRVIIQCCEDSVAANTREGFVVGVREHVNVKLCRVERFRTNLALVGCITTV